jgi:uncharacterized protein YqjF (DUF2071 family)
MLEEKIDDTEADEMGDKHVMTPADTSLRADTFAMKDTFLSAQWRNLIMANYPVSQDALMPFLPKGVELDYYDNNTYVSLVGFMFEKTKLFNISIPIFGTFEEINLRFYVKRIENGKVKRGVVFINETVPFKAVAWLANKLYKEHYITIPTKNSISISHSKHVRYEWKIKGQWNHLEVSANLEPEKMAPGSMEEFIFEHYYGYTKISDQLSQEYRINHPTWLINKVSDYSVKCDFKSMYGNAFSSLTKLPPDSVFIAAGSPVTVNWKRTSF